MRDQCAQATCTDRLPELSIPSMSSRKSALRRDYLINLTSVPSAETEPKSPKPTIPLKLKIHELSPDVNVRRQHNNLPYTFDYRSSPALNAQESTPRLVTHY